MNTAVLNTINTGSLGIAYEEHGPPDGAPVVLLHGFPYSPRAFDAVAPALAARGHRVVVPYLRGYGPTRFLSEATSRSGQQAALGADLRDLIDALELQRPIVAGYDWGGRAACIVAALWPERVGGLVSVMGYNIQDIAGSQTPVSAEAEYRLWYQYYLHTPRGVAGLTADRRGLARLLWRLWSPGWAFDDETFDASAAAFDNPDFVDVVVQSYRHRFGYAAGDPALEPIEAALAQQPPIGVPSIVLDGAEDGVTVPKTDSEMRQFTALVRREIVAGAGHNLPQEKPEAMVRAILELAGRETAG